MFCYLVSLDCCVGCGYILSVVNSVVHVRALVVSFAMFWFNMMCLVSLCLLLGCCGNDVCCDCLLLLPIQWFSFGAGCLAKDCFLCCG